MRIILEAAFLLISMVLVLTACSCLNGKKEETVTQKVKNWLVGDKCRWGKLPASFEPDIEYRIERFLPAAELFDREAGTRFIAPVEQLYAARFSTEEKVAKPLGCEHPAENQQSMVNTSAPGPIGKWCDHCGAIYIYGSGGWSYPTMMPGY